MLRLCRLAGSCCLLAGCQTWLGDYTADRRDPVDTAPLCKVEHSAFHQDLDLDGDAQAATLEEYYANANEDLMSHFEEVASDYSKGTTARSATYLQGEAGAGKSFVIKQLVDVFADEDACSVSLADALSQPNDSMPTQSWPDLATIDESLTLSELPGWSQPSDFSLTTFLEQHGCTRDGLPLPLVALDGIDEIHPSSARVLLRELEKYLRDTGSNFVHVLVLGRPEGFSPWLTDPMRPDVSDVVMLQRLNTPAYVTKGDIEFRLKEYIDFAMLGDQVDEAGGFDTYLDSVSHALERHPFLRYSLSNLAVGNVVLQHTAPGLSESEHELKDEIFEDLLARDADTHDRPGAGSRYDSAYLRLLERLAATYADVNSRGEFTVSPKDTLPFVDDSGNTIGNILVTTILERSGLAYLTSPTSTTKRFKFSPFWVQGYLVERFDQNETPRYVYKGCD